jgi:signal transduction histidine kinase
MERPIILVIDDETGPRESLRMILKDRYEVVVAVGPDEGLQLARDHQPHLVFCDIKMPGMEGPEVLRRLKELDPDMEVALITAYAAVDTAQQALRYGAIDYLTKPFSVQDINQVTERALERRSETMRQRLLLQQLAPATQELSETLGALTDTGAPDQSLIYQNLTEAHSTLALQLNRIARLNAIGELAAEVAHDVNNFLTAMLLRIEVLLMSLRRSPEVNADTVRAALGDIVRAARDGAQAVQRISTFTKTDPYEPSEMVNVNDVIADVVNIVAGQFTGRGGATLLTELGEVELVFGSAAALRTTLLNTVINARHAIGEDDGLVTIATATDEGETVIRISDTGCGILPEVLEHITEPFFTTKGDQGSGLGLSVARKVIAGHGGTLDFESEVGQGTTVIIRLPASPHATASLPAQPDLPVPAHFVAPEVLLVDDDTRAVNLIERFLVASAFRVATAPDAETAIRLLQQCVDAQAGLPAYVITDLRLPGLLGTDLARRVKELSPQTKVILLSAYLTDEATAAHYPDVDALVRKPFDLTELTQHLEPLP